MPSSSEELKSAQAVIVLACGYRKDTPGLSNSALAKVVWSLKLGNEVFLLLQTPFFAKWFNTGSGKVFFIGNPSVGGDYPQTYQLLSEASQICRQNNWTRVVIVAHPDHMGRSVWTAKKFGLDVLVADSINVPYDLQSVQIWTRNRFFNIPREIVARIIYLYKGYF